MATTPTYQGLESKGQSFSATKMPETTKIEAAPTFKASNTSVGINAPKSQTFKGIQRNLQFSDEAKAFVPSEQSLVQTQLGKVLGKESDLMKRSIAMANQDSSARGMRNSDSAAGAGVNAALNYAMPIASQDAGMYAGVDAAIQNFLNNQALSEQGAFNTSRQSAQDAGQSSSLMRQDLQGNAELNNQTSQQQAIMSAQDATQTGGLNRQQGVINQALQLDGANQNSGLSAQDATQRSGMQAQGANEGLRAAEQNFRQQVGLNSQQYGIDSALSAQDSGQQMQRATQGFMQQLGLNSQQHDFNRVISDQEYRQALGISEKDFQEALGAAQQAFGFDSRLSAQDSGQAMQRAEQSFMQQLGLNSQQHDFNRILSDQEYRQAIGISEKDFQEALGTAQQAYGFDSSLQSEGNQQAMQRAEQGFMQQLGLNSQQHDFNRILSDQEYRQALGVSEKDFQEALGTAEQAFGFDSSLSSQRSYESIKEIYAQGGVQSQLQMQQDAAQMDRLVADGTIKFGSQIEAQNHEAAMSQLDTQQKAILAQIGLKNETLLQQSSQANAMYRDMAQQMAVIQSNPDMSVTAKEKAIAQLIDWSSEGMVLQNALLSASGVGGLQYQGSQAGQEMTAQRDAQTEELVALYNSGGKYEKENAKKALKALHGDAWGAQVNLVTQAGAAPAASTVPESSSLPANPDFKAFLGGGNTGNSMFAKAANAIKNSAAQTAAGV